MRKLATLGAIIGALSAAAPATAKWILVHPRAHPHVRDCRVFDYKPAPLMVVGGPSGEGFAIGAITCTHSVWPHIRLTVCVQRLHGQHWLTVRCRAAERPDIGIKDYLTTDAGSFQMRPGSRYREKLRVRVRHMSRIFYGPESLASLGQPVVKAV